MNSPDHAHELRRLAEAVRHFDDAEGWLKRAGPELLAIAQAGTAYRDALKELREAARTAVLTANLDGTETSPLTAESGR